MNPFRKINVHFKFRGDIQEDKAKKAIEMSMEKYCSATAQFSGSAEISSSFENFI